MPRNTLKSFPTAMLRRGLAHFHPGCIAVIQPLIDPPIEPPGSDPVRVAEVPPVVPACAPLAPCPHEVREPATPSPVA